METREVLISPGFGAGWSTWVCSYGDNQGEAKRFALFYQPLIDAIKDAQSKSIDDGSFAKALAQFKREFEEKFGDEPYCGGARDLRVVEVDGPFIVREYDGSETIQLRGSTDWI